MYGLQFSYLGSRLLDFRGTHPSATERQQPLEAQPQPPVLVQHQLPVPQQPQLAVALWTPPAQLRPMHADLVDEQQAAGRDDVHGHGGERVGAVRHGRRGPLRRRDRRRRCPTRK